MIIPARFNGPEGTGNGGYSCGVFATAGLGPGAAGGVAQVTLRKPPPLGVPLSLAGGDVVGPAGEVVASVTTVEPFAPVLAGVVPEAAATASRSYAGFADHPFPTCYVCGPARDDGLRIFPGPLPGDAGVAAVFRTPDEVDATTVWAALDCPGGWSIIGPGRPYVLGRMAAIVDALPEPGTDYVVVGRVAGVDGRKAAVVSALFAEDGTLLAHAKATWIAI